MVEFLGQFFVTMNNMGAEIFEFAWVAAIVQFFSYFGWALYVTGLVVSVFDVAVEAQSGRADIKGTVLNAIKGFFAVNLFTIVPVQLYKFCVSLQGMLASNMTTLFELINVDMNMMKKGVQ